MQEQVGTLMYVKVCRTI